ncbi:MAG: ThiF family adenylyltransferase [Cytophagales bacterium]
MKNIYSVVVGEDFNTQMLDHLIRADGQEDLMFATYCPSSGSNRLTGIISSIILPNEGDRLVHGNVEFYPHYLERALKIASERKEGLVFIHSHPFPGWQSMSEADVVAETRISPTVFGATGLPLIGMTTGCDGTWSSRFWEKNTKVKRTYNRHWCSSVRVTGKGLKVYFNNEILKPRFDAEKQLRTISAWGTRTQEDISRLKVGIVGLGSVGSIVAEILSRTGFSFFTLIDFDGVEKKNLDRTLGTYNEDVGNAKVKTIANSIRKSGTSPNIVIEECESSICEEAGYKEALDCDFIFSCVDRPWPRQILNFISYAHLIPVIDGGIKVRTNKSNTKLVGSDWRAHTVGYGKVCLECIGQFQSEFAKLESDGYLDDPEYIEGSNVHLPNEFNENVFPFSAHLAAMEVLQALSVLITPSGIADVGQQNYHFVTGSMDIERGHCEDNCFYSSIVGKGDTLGLKPFGRHKVAEAARSKRKKS